jgi:hypothetical protein
MGAKRVFLHIGQGKTGTSTIQGFLARNRQALASHGYLYPTISRYDRHLELSLYAKTDSTMVNAPSWWRMPWDSASELRVAIEKDLPAHIAESGCENVVFSDEGLWRHPMARLTTLVEALRPIDELVIVVYLRRQDEHVVSRYKQTMRDGRDHLLSDFLARPKTEEAWQYDTTLRNLRATFPAARLVVRPYHASRFRERTLVEDFLDAIDATDFDYDKSSTETLRLNVSLDAYTTEYLRRWNAAHGRANKPLARRLTKLADGPNLRMEEEEHQTFWERLRPSNTRLVEEFLPEAEDIFLASQRPRGGVTQREITDEDLARLEDRLAASSRRRTA